MLVSRRAAPALVAGLISLLPSAPTALAAGPATVTVRVEGLTETKLPATQLTTTSEPVVKDGKPEDSCPGTSAIGALQLATGGDWSGTWEPKFRQYEINAIDGEAHAFGSGYYWDLWINRAEATVGACEAQLEAGEEVLLFPCSEAAACPTPLGIQAPAGANVGEPVSVTVNRYSPAGDRAPASGATVTGAERPSDSNGHATLRFPSSGSITVRASAPGAVRAETTVCVHNGDDGTCGTGAPAGASIVQAPARTGVLGSSTAAPYIGPYAVVAKATGLIDGHVYRRRDSPRVLTGSVLAHTAIASVSIELRRSYRGRCEAYDGTRERFVPARCGRGGLFKVSTEPSFSYLLPASLPAGRYVLDIEATDAAGNRTRLARGTSRIVFYVR